MSVYAGSFQGRRSLKSAPFARETRSIFILAVGARRVPTKADGFSRVGPPRSRRVNSKHAPDRRRRVVATTHLGAKSARDGPLADQASPSGAEEKEKRGRRIKMPRRA